MKAEAIHRGGTAGAASGSSDTAWRVIGELCAAGVGAAALDSGAGVGVDPERLVRGAAALASLGFGALGARAVEACVEAGVDRGDLGPILAACRAGRVHGTGRVLEVLAENTGRCREGGGLVGGSIAALATGRAAIESGGLEVHEGAGGGLIAAPGLGVAPGLGGAWSGWRVMAAGHEAARAAASAVAVEAFPPPVVMIGFEAPWAIGALDARLTAGEGEGALCRRRVLVVEADGLGAALAMGAARLPAMAAGRSVWFIGAGAVEDLASWLERSSAWTLPRQAVLGSASPAGRSLAGRVMPVLSGAAAAQAEAVERARERAEAAAAARGTSGSAARLAAGACGALSLRVLLLSSAHSTYVRHAMDGLAAALGRLGHRAVVLIEPDGWSTMSPLASLGAMAEFEPDLVIGPNHPRATRAGVLARGVPYVCWVQDMVPALLDAATPRGAMAGDVYAGYMPPDAFRRVGYDPADFLPWPVPADAGRFHDGPIDGALMERYACDIAFVSHHGEPVERLSGRLVGLLRGVPSPARFMGGLMERLRVVIGDRSSAAFNRIPVVTREALREALGCEPEAASVSVVQHQISEPLAGRMFRHRAARWAAEAARGHGLRLRLYGRGWASNPEFSRYAAGEVGHGEALRACYAAAGIHLHADLNGATHQRVLECALSGGLCVPCFDHSLLLAAEMSACRAIHASGRGPDNPDEDPIGHDPGCHAGSARLWSIRGSLGLSTPRYIRVMPNPDWAAMDHGGAAWERFDATRLLEPLAEGVFSSAEGLGAIAQRARDDRGWRAARSGAIRRRVIGGYTLDVFAGELIAHAAARAGRAGSACVGEGVGEGVRAVAGKGAFVAA